MKDSRAADEPVVAKDAKLAVRYEMMAQLREGAPPSADEFTKIVADHAKFIESGGGGGRWQTIVTSGGLELGLVLGLYCPPQDVSPDGSQAMLSHTQLGGLDLRRVSLPYADLCGAACQGQDLSEANLEGSLATDADFTGSNFRGADLAGADFSRSELVNCDFREAHMEGADLENADLSGSDFRGAKLDGCRIPGVIMDGCQWTDGMQPRGPVIIVQSRLDIPNGIPPEETKGLEEAKDPNSQLLEAASTSPC